ncbi:hypothetical protein [Archangium violaceum]|uniref:hypothetical protein n=1 Tax=Archangium violaceum TaxID=83451 RepID=UPI0036DB521C
MNRDARGWLLYVILGAVFALAGCGDGGARAEAQAVGASPRALSASDGILLSAGANHSLAVRPDGTVWA